MNPCSPLIAFVAAVTSRKMTNACPLIFIVFIATISKTEPNWEKRLYKDLLNSEINDKSSLLAFIGTAGIKRQQPNSEFALIYRVVLYNKIKFTFFLNFLINIVYVDGTTWFQIHFSKNPLCFFNSSTIFFADKNPQNAWKKSRRHA